VDLRHRFTVPTTVPDAWAHFNDIASVAECFPGATVTSVDPDSFSGTVKVKLGPIALVYSGSGRFVEKDEDAHRFVVEAKGKDKRGNGTAGATVTVTMTPASGVATDVEVVTDLAITGKPAQFGRGVMQDVSDKLLGQFVACLEQRLSGGGEQATEPSSPTVASSPLTPDSGEQATEPPPRPVAAAPPPRAYAADSADLGAAVVPVLVKSYGPVAVAAVAGLVVGWLVGRRR
jgi:carbon monoxide dehydrogenase subunit G